MNTEEFKYYIGIKLGSASKAYYFGTNYDDLKINDPVVIETVSGLEMGKVATSLMPIKLYASSLMLKPILRKATIEDVETNAYYEKRADLALDITATEIRRLNLPMNLLSANYTLDGTKITITYTSDSRVDFRELLRLLAPQLHCRIELHQIANRDKAKLVGGIAICGLPLCCTTFINEFDSISISRVKNQMLTLNIPKLSGPCGKLICCLLFEDDMYTSVKKNYPTIGTVIHINDVSYTVTAFNILARTIKLENPLENKIVSLEEFNNLTNKISKNKQKQNPSLSGAN